jgi:disulfide bond formation protein DsbB
MPVQRANTFFATGAVILAVAVIALVLLALASLVSKSARRSLSSLSRSFHGLGPRIAFGMAAVAMAGSLYYSEVVGFLPCEYCWYQRIAMYPLVPIMGIASFTGDRAVRRYALPLASIGALIAAYHYTIQQFPNLAVGECALGIPCTAAYVWKFGFVSIPFMALVSFSVIISVLLLDRPNDATDEAPTEIPMEETP